MDNLETGDLLLFSDNSTGWFGYFTSAIKYFTNSKYSHIGMVLKNPTFIHPSLKGIYVWESSWEGKADPQDGKIKLGVQITPLLEIVDTYKKNNGHIYSRKLKFLNNNNNDNLFNFRLLIDKKLRKITFNDSNLKKIHNIVYNKPYDIVPKDWIEAIFRKDDNPQKTDRFWCSALVGYIYTQLGILDKNTDWSILRPSDFSIENEYLDMTGICLLDDNEKKLF
jgi:hypothetical protein